MKNKTSFVLLIIGLIFVLNTFVSRYIVVPGYLEGLEAGGSTLQGASQVASTWKIIRYLLWAYSFKLGIYFVAMSALAQTNMPSIRKWSFAIVGLVYIGFAYAPLPDPGSIVFGLTGGVMTLAILYITWRWASQRDGLEEHLKKASDYRLAGYFFFSMATYTLCPLLGVKTFALSPEKMLRYGLQAEAASFAFHLLIELILGWLLIAYSFRVSDEAKQ